MLALRKPLLFVAKYAQLFFSRPQFLLLRCPLGCHAAVEVLHRLIRGRTHRAGCGHVLLTPRGNLGHDFRNRRRRQHDNSGTPLAIRFRQRANRSKDFSLRGADRLGPFGDPFLLLVALVRGSLKYAPRSIHVRIQLIEQPSRPTPLANRRSERAMDFLE